MSLMVMVRQNSLQSETSTPRASQCALQIWFYFVDYQTILLILPPVVVHFPAVFYPHCLQFPITHYLQPEAHEEQSPVIPENSTTHQNIIPIFCQN